MIGRWGEMNFPPDDRLLVRLPNSQARSPRKVESTEWLQALAIGAVLALLLKEMPPVSHHHDQNYHSNSLCQPRLPYIPSRELKFQLQKLWLMGGLHLVPKLGLKCFKIYNQS